MVWKNTQSTDGGNSKVWGGRDHDKLGRLLNGELNVDNVAINLPATKWEFETLALLLRNRSSAWGYNFVVPILSGVSSHVQVGMPLITQNDTLVTLKSPGEIENKRFDFRKNTVIGGGSSGAASGLKTGSIVCGRQTGSQAGEGLLKGHIDRPTLPIGTADPSPIGHCWDYGTTTAQNTIAGIEYPWPLTRRQFNPRFKAKVYVPSTTTNTRMYVGLSSDATMEADNIPVTHTESAVIVGWRSGDGTIRIFHNAGSSSGTVSPGMFDTGIPKSTVPKTIEIAVRNEIPRTVVTIADVVDAFGNEGNVQTFNINSNALLENTNLFPTVTMSNTDGTDRHFWIGGLEMDMTM